MKKNILISLMLAALMALTSCTVADDPVPEPTPPPTETVLGEWFAQVEASGTIDGLPYDLYAVYLTFQNDGHGLFMQYFLYQGVLMKRIGRETDFRLDGDGNISVNIRETQVQLGQNMRLDGERLTFNIPDHNLYGLTLLRPTAAQQQLIISQWGIYIDQGGADSGDDDGGDVMTEVTGDGADEPARTRE